MSLVVFSVVSSTLGVFSLLLSVAVVVILNDVTPRADRRGKIEECSNFDKVNILKEGLVIKDDVDRKLDLFNMKGVVDGKKAPDNVSNRKRVFCK
jgi:hypothetical protein